VPLRIPSTVLLWVALGAASSAWAQPPQQNQPPDPAMMTDSAGLDEAARQIFMAGRNLYELGRFAEAAAQFEQAYELSHRPPLLYNIYVAYRDAGDRDKSAQALENYLRENPDAPDRVNLEARLESLRQSIAAEQASRDTAADEARAAELARQEEERRQAAEAERSREEEEQRRAASRDATLAWVVTGVGGALIVGGAVTGVMALGAASTVSDGCRGGLCIDDGANDERATLALVTDVLLVSGLVVAGVGLTWAILKMSSGGDDAEGASVSAMCGPTGCAASYTSRF
jgi:tetratricopeptide (TPR) repeat protein